MLHGVKAIWLEVETVPLYWGQPLKADVERYLRARRFTKWKDTVDRISGDQLWVASTDSPEWPRRFASRIAGLRRGLR